MVVYKPKLFNATLRYYDEPTDALVVDSETEELI